MAVLRYESNLVDILHDVRTRTVIVGFISHPRALIVSGSADKVKRSIPSLFLVDDGQTRNIRKVPHEQRARLCSARFFDGLRFACPQGFPETPYRDGAEKDAPI
jgi:hypothetical protein